MGNFVSDAIDWAAEELEERRQQLRAQIAGVEAKISDLRAQIVELEAELALVEALRATSQGIHSQGWENDTTMATVSTYSIGQSGACDCHREQYTNIKTMIDTEIYKLKCEELKLKIENLKGEVAIQMGILAGLRAALGALG